MSYTEKEGLSGREVLRFGKLKGNRQERNLKLKEQLDEFKEEAKKGKIICITDLMINAEGEVR